MKPRHHPNAGLTKELFQRLEDEFNTLKLEHNQTFTKYVQEVKQCDRQQARKYLQRFGNVIKERNSLSPATARNLKDIISDELLRDLQAYLTEHYYGKPSKGRPEVDKTFAGLTEILFQRYREEVNEFKATCYPSAVACIMDVKGCTKEEAMTIQSVMNSLYSENAKLTPRKVIQLEGLLSRKLFSEIAKYVFNHYEWPESLDDEVDRITLEYRKKGKIGRDKASVKRYLYKALAMGL